MLDAKNEYHTISSQEFRNIVDRYKSAMSCCDDIEKLRNLHREAMEKAACLSHLSTFQHDYFRVDSVLTQESILRRLEILTGA